VRKLLLNAVVVGVVVGVVPASALALEPPRAALQYRAELTRAVHLVWGLHGPIATMAAQVHQESAWRPDARSPFAHGLTQFTPDTAQWIGGLDPALRPADTGNPVWALRAMARYNRWLYDRVPNRSNACARWIDILRAYNGGLGWVQREARTGKPCAAFRSAANCAENLDYPVRILIRHQPRYLSWGPGVHCA